MKNNNFDLSNFSFFNIQKSKFSGHVYVKDWKDVIEKIYEYKDGKISKKIKLNKAGSPKNNARITYVCHDEEVETCVVTDVACIRIGDDPPCGPENSTTVYTYTCTYEINEVCVEIPDDNDPTACENSPNPDQCMCDLYNIGCDDAPTCAQMGLSDEVCCLWYGQNCAPPPPPNDECAQATQMANQIASTATLNTFSETDNILNAESYEQTYNDTWRVLRYEDAMNWAELNSTFKFKYNRTPIANTNPLLYRYHASNFSSFDAYTQQMSISSAIYTPQYNIVTCDYNHSSFVNVNNKVAGKFENFIDIGVCKIVIMEKVLLESKRVYMSN